MNANRYFSVPFDAYDDYGMKLLRRRWGGVAAYGRWHVLLGLLYDADGLIDYSDDASREMLADELEMTEEELDGFMADLASIDFISSESLGCGHIVSHGVCDELNYRKERIETGKKGGRPRKKTE
jgi:hypothetical protein